MLPRESLASETSGLPCTEKYCWNLGGKHLYWGVAMFAYKRKHRLTFQLAPLPWYLATSREQIEKKWRNQTLLVQQRVES